MDPAHIETEIILTELIKRIQKEYGQAAAEIQIKLLEYFKKFRRKDAYWQQLVNDGKTTQQDYINWRIGQLIVGKRWMQLRDELVLVLLNSRSTALKMIAQDVAPVYSLNHNYITYDIEKQAGVDTLYEVLEGADVEDILIDVINKKTAVQAAEGAEKAAELFDTVKISDGWTIYDLPTIERLLMDDPKLLPDPGRKTAQLIAEGKAELWDKQQIQSVATQSILQGESMDQVAERLAQKVSDYDMKAQIRNARTMITGAENAGRVEGMLRADEMGLEPKKQWIATLDMRTRHKHRLLDGEKVDPDKPFVVEGDEILFPGDPYAKPYLVYNCRCTLVTQTKHFYFDTRPSDAIRNDPLINGMSYDQWKKSREVWTKKKMEEYKRDLRKKGLI